jgi:hypothetical protein
VTCLPKFKIGDYWWNIWFTSFLMSRTIKLLLWLHTVELRWVVAGVSVALARFWGTVIMICRLLCICCPLPMNCAVVGLNVVGTSNVLFLKR